jgi:serine/threonine-protein kinase RsbW
MKDIEIETSIPSTTRSISRLKRLVDSINWEGIKAAGATRRRCLHVLVEGVNNAIFHAHNGDGAQEIRIKITGNNGALDIEIKDRGPGFDLKSVGEPPLDSDRGRGLLIIRKLADEVSYEGNTLKARLYEK